jgi:hypothetical protein
MGVLVHPQLGFLCCAALPGFFYQKINIWFLNKYVISLIFA